MSDSFFKRFRRKISASLSLKLISIFVGGSIALMMIIGGLSQFGLERHFLSTARPVLSHYIEYLSEEVGTPPSIENAQRLTKSWPLTIRIFRPSENVRWASDGRVREPRLKKQRSRKRFKGRGPVYWDHGTVFMRKDAADAAVYYGLRFRPSGPPWVPLIFMGLVLLGLYGFYLLTRRLFSPIKTIEAGISKIGEGQLDHRIKVDRNDELGALAQHVNQMAEHFEGMMQAKRDLLLAISHELKSPLARSRVSLALLPESEQQQALLDDQLEMQRLIDQIIEAERSQGDFATIHRASTDMQTLIERVIASFEQATEIKTSIAVSEEVNVDKVQIERLLRNLLENALRYNRPELGAVGVSVMMEESDLVLLVRDHGAGIKANHIGRLTEAFYRADTSRVRKTGGLGLGLYLCQAVVNAHGGSLEISSELGQGTQVRCRIPL